MGTYRKRHYEYTIVTCCFLLMFCNVGLPSTSFSVYQPYLVALPGVGDAAGSLIIGTRTFVSLICMILVGRYYNALDCRLGCFIAGALSALGLFAFGLARSLPWLLVAAVICGAAYGLGGMIGITLLVNRWFKTDVGTAAGLSAVGSGVASIIIPVLAEYVIRTRSLQLSFWMEAAMALAITVVVGLLLRNRPEDIGAVAHGAARHDADLGEGPSRKPVEQHHEDGAHPEIHPTPVTEGGVCLSPAATRRFLLAMAFVGAICVTAATFLSVLLVSEGFPHSFAALMLSVYGICLTFSTAFTGRHYDMIGAVRGTIVSFTAIIVGLVCLCLTPTGLAVFAVAGSVLYGAGMAVGTIGIPIWSIQLSTAANRSTVIRQFQVGYATGSFVYNLVPGVLMDLCGTYVASYAILVVFAGAALALILTTYRQYTRD